MPMFPLDDWLLVSPQVGVVVWLDENITPYHHNLICSWELCWSLETPQCWVLTQNMKISACKDIVIGIMTHLDSGAPLSTFKLDTSLGTLCDQSVVEILNAYHNINKEELIMKVNRPFYCKHIQTESIICFRSLSYVMWTNSTFCTPVWCWPRLSWCFTSCQLQTHPCTTKAPEGRPVDAQKMTSQSALLRLTKGTAVISQSMLYDWLS